MTQKGELTHRFLVRALARLDALELELASYGRLFAPDSLLDAHRRTMRLIDWLEARLRFQAATLEES